MKSIIMKENICYNKYIIKDIYDKCTKMPDRLLLLKLSSLELNESEFIFSISRLTEKTDNIRINDINELWCFGNSLYIYIFI